MTSSTIAPSIDQAALQMFNDNFLHLAQQTKSRLGSTPAVKYLESEGKTNHLARIGRIELAEVNTRNPDKQFGDYNLDNRQLSKRRFTRTIQIDSLYDINELIKDPTSDILTQLVNAKERVIDRIIASAAAGDVLVGAPDAAPTAVTPANDGVITIDATGTGMTYNVIQQITENFINNDLELMDFQNTCLAISGAENTDLMSEDRFINNDYISGRPVEKGYMEDAGMYMVKLFAGSKVGGIQVNNPVLPESATERTNIVLAPESVAVSMKLAIMDVDKSRTKVNSWDITIDLWINAMRTEGVRVQLVTTSL
jgi:hypothetical protein